MNRFFKILMLTSLTSILVSCQKDPVMEKSGTYAYVDGKFEFVSTVIKDAVTDIDGNTYDAVKLGDQVWMAENLRTTKYADGTTIPMGSSTSTTTAYRYYPNNKSTNVDTCGYLYNWKAVMRNSPSSSSNPSGVQGVCPNGWHVPSDAEWTQLTDYVSSQSQYVCGSSNNNIAKALASTTGWNSSSSTCDVGNNPSVNNATGFSAVPAGYYNGGYDFFGDGANFWSATQNNSNNAYNRNLNYNNANVNRNNNNKYGGYSVRCLRGDGSSPTLPTVTTTSVTSITYYSAVSGGNVTNSGGLGVTARGVCWSTSQYPTINSSHTSNGSGTGSFSSSITDLSPNTTYYVRAYATNSAGTAYGSQVSFTTAQVYPPTVTTNSVTNITANSAFCGGNVTAQGTYSVTDRGVCWSTSQNPTIVNNHITCGFGSGSFACNITGLSHNTTYYVRAYATNSAGTSYGTQKSFTTTVAPCGTSTVTDYDNNTYNTVQIGNQCWMKENLKTTHYADGTPISLGSSTSTSTAYRYYPDNNSLNVSTYGYLYNWKAVMRNSSSSPANPSGVQGICPNGWHVPSDAEWTRLTDYVSSQSEYVCGSNSSYIAKALASSTGWSSSSNTCAVGNNPSANNATGFSAVPAGGYDGYYYYFGSYADFWSATQYDSNNAFFRPLFYGSADVNRRNGDKYFELSVRCLRD